MSTTRLSTTWQEWFSNQSKHMADGAYDTSRFSSTISGNGWSPLRHGNSRLDELISTAQFNIQHQESFPGGGERASGTGSANGSAIRKIGGRNPDGSPAFDQLVPNGGYLWWYVDGISDDGQHGITIIAFVGSVFSPYYLWANRKQFADPNHYCCLNVAIYSPNKKRWTMTERGKRLVHRDATHFQIGPSQLHWNGNSLVIDITERAVPFGQKVIGKVTVHPEQLFNYSVPLDQLGKHRWGPLAPTSRVEVAFSEPQIHWSGHAYLDSNEGDEPINRPFQEWDWARALLKDQSTAVVYDVREKNGAENLLALRFKHDGTVENFEIGQRFSLPPTLWKIKRHLRSDSAKPTVIQDLEDTPFYSRSILQGDWLGENNLMCMHETLNVPRFSSTAVQMMLPWRMPRVT
jgi:carotenoid 1,2-hydratase